MLIKPAILLQHGTVDYIMTLMQNKPIQIIERALKDLGIVLITANSPQAKRTEGDLIFKTTFTEDIQRIQLLRQEDVLDKRKII